MADTDTQGGRANFTGNRLERFVEHTLTELGYRRLESRKERTLDFIHGQEQPSYARQVVIGESIYGTRLRCDFILNNHEKLVEPLIIEAKWQESSGSVDEKYPFLVHNIKQCHPHPTLVLLDGSGYKPGAEKWLRAQTDGKLLAVLNMSEFYIWADAHL